MSAAGQNRQIPRAAKGLISSALISLLVCLEYPSLEALDMTVSKSEIKICVGPGLLEQGVSTFFILVPNI